MGERAASRGIRWPEALAAGLVLLLYASCLYRLPTHTFWSPDEGGKFLQAVALRWNGGIELALPYVGERLDPELRFYASRSQGESDTFIYPTRTPQGEVSFHWPLWFTYLVKLPTVLFGAAGGYGVALLAGWLTAVIAGLLAREIDASLALPAILVVGLATPVWFFSLCFWEHTAATAFGLAAVYVVVRNATAPRSWLFAALLTCGAVMMRIEMVALVAALLLVFSVMALRGGALRCSVAVRRRPLIWVSGPLAAVVLVWLASASLPGRHADLLLSLPSRLARLQWVPAALGGILASPYWADAPLLGPAAAHAGLAAIIVCSLAPLFRRTWVEATLTLAGLAMLALYTGSLVASPQHYRSLHGIFPIAPFMVLAAHGLRAAWSRGDHELSVFAGLSLAYMVAGIAGLGLAYVDPQGDLALGLAWGQRYLLLLYPLLALLSLAGVQAYWRSQRPLGVRLAVGGLTVALIGIGVAFQIRGLEESRQTRMTLATWQAALQGEANVITDIWWLPAGLAESYTRKPIFVVRARAEVSEWMDQASARGISRFTFTSLRPIRLADLGGEKRNLLRHSYHLVDGLYVTNVSFRSGVRRRVP